MGPQVVRIWRTGLVEPRSPEYEHFARSVSLPMFRRQPGFAGVVFARSGPEGVVITLWQNYNAAEALADSADYQATVRALQATGLLCPPQRIELLDLHGAWLGRTGHDKR